MVRPVGAALLTIVGGFFIVAGGLFFALVGAIFAVLGIVSGIFLLGILVGIFVLVVGFLMIVVPSGHTVWGVLAIVLALASIPVAFGGFFLGFLLTLIGGIVAVRWRRPPERFITAEGHRVAPPAG